MCEPSNPLATGNQPPVRPLYQTFNQGQYFHLQPARNRRGGAGVVAIGLFKGVDGVAQHQQAGVVGCFIGGQHPEFLHGGFVLAFGGQIHGKI